ncbi:TetR/AcrR family transcriptional regulator [Bradyrhizobium erythrophlei]|uniref:TetR/AcrR family transcriptional regulator n=1 Tax=Bradyrhizobium erythrophlei TaxID=1437360 RepID=UPI0035EDA7C2
MPAAAQTYQETIELHRRQLIVDAARRVFEASGLERASIRAIAQEAGCTTGAIYPLFRSKEELFSVVLGESLKAVTGQVHAAIDGIVVPAKALRRATLAIYRYYDAHPSELTLSLVLFNGERTQKIGRGSDEKLKRQLDELLALLAELVRKATAKPFLPMARLETSALITYLVGLLALKQGRKIDVLGNNAAVLLAHYTKNMVARLGGV